MREDGEEAEDVELKRLSPWGAEDLLDARVGKRGRGC